MRYTYDDEADALYVRVREGVPVVKSIVINEETVVDVDEVGAPIGIEIIGASEGVHLKDVAVHFGLQSQWPSLHQIEATRFQPAGR